MYGYPGFGDVKLELYFFKFNFLLINTSHFQHLLAYPLARRNSFIESLAKSYSSSYALTPPQSLNGKS